MHSRVDHEAELTCVLSVGPHTHVRAEGYSHASLVRTGEGLLNLHADDHSLFDLRRRQQAVGLCHLQNRDASNDRRHMKSAFGDEQLERASVEEAPMLDRIHPPFDRRIYPPTPIPMSTAAPPN